MEGSEGSGHWYRSGVMCACDHEVLIWYQSNSAHKQCMMPPQLSEKGLLLMESWSNRAAPRGIALPHRTGGYSLRVHHIRMLMWCHGRRQHATDGRMKALADPKGDTRDAPRVHIFSFSCSFRQKICKIILIWEWAHPFGKTLDPPLARVYNSVELTGLIIISWPGSRRWLC